MSGRDNQRRREGLQRAYEAGLRDTMSTAAGRTTIWGILEKTRLNSELMTGNSHTFYNVGARDVGLSLMVDLVSICRTETRLMEDEAFNRAARVAFEEQGEQASDPDAQLFIQTEY